MSNDLSLRVRIGAELGELKSALSSIQGELGKLSASAQENQRATQKTTDEVARSTKAAAKSTGALESTIGGLRGQLAGLAAGFSAIYTINAFKNITDEAKNLEGRLRQVTSSTAELVSTQERLRDVAKETRAGYANTVDLYFRLAKATEDLAGVNDETVLSLTETINKLTALSGTAGPGAQAALFQFGQALQTGALRGDEFNSVMEQAPALAEAIADGLRKSKGELRKLAEEGKLTASKIINAIIKMQEATGKNFQLLPPTIDQQLGQLRDEWARLVNEFDKSTGVSVGVVKALKFITDNMQEIILAAKILGAGLLAIGSQKILSALAFVVTRLIQIGLEAKAAAVSVGLIQKASLLAVAAFAGWELGTWARENIPWVEKFGIALAGGIHKAIAGAKATLEAFGIYFSQLFDAPLDTVRTVLAELLLAISDFVRKIPGIGNGLANSIVTAAEKIRPTGEAGQKLVKALAELGDRTSKELQHIDDEYADLFANVDAKNKKKETNNTDGNAGLPSPAGPTGSVNSNALMRADVEQQLKELDRLYDQGLVRLEDYYAKKRHLSQQLTDIEIAEIDRRTAAEDKKDQLDQLATERAVAQKKGQFALSDIAAEEKRALDERLQQQKDYQAQLLDLEEKSVDARRLELESKYKETLQRLRTEGDQAGIDTINGIINLELAQTRLDALETRISRALERLRNAEESTANRVQSGDADPAQAQAEVQAARDQALQQLQAARAEFQALVDQDVPGAKASLASLELEIDNLKSQSVGGLEKAVRTLRAQMAEFTQSMASMAANAGVDAMTNFFMDIATGAKSAKDALKDFVSSFAQSIAQMMARALAMYAVLQILNAIPGGSAVAAAMDVGAKVKHTGGVIGRGGTVRNVPSFVFAGAPRYHSGGVAGLKPGEVPAILQTGEEVLARNDPRNVMNGGGQQQGGGVRILNVVDPSLVSDFMSSSSGEEVIVNAISRNAGAIKQVLV